jgi:HEAT repeat protein
VRRVLFVVLIAAGFALLILAVRNFRTPTVNGKSADEWLRRITSSNETERVQAVLAVRELGTNVLPEIFRRLEAEDSPLRSNAVRLLSWQRVVRLPPSRSAENYRQAFRGFQELGTNRPAAIPGLVRMLQNSAIADRASGLLVQVGDEVIPALLIAATNSAGTVRRRAIADLGARRVSAPGVFDTLLQAFLSDPDPATRSMAAHSLGRLPDLPVTAMNPLIKALDDPDINISSAAARALADGYGPRAKAAIPALTRLWKRGGIWSSANYALTKIDPDAAESVGAKVVSKPNPYE